MKPLSQALDIFQNEESMSLGCVLPVLTVLKEKLVEMEKDRSITHCIPLVGSLLDSISARFNHLFLQKHLQLASLSDPHFNLWVQDKESKESDTDLLKNDDALLPQWSFSKFNITSHSFCNFFKMLFC
jgi:hypothetical protein